MGIQLTWSRVGRSGLIRSGDRSNVDAPSFESDASGRTPGAVTHPARRSYTRRSLRPPKKGWGAPPFAPLVTFLRYGPREGTRRAGGARFDRAPRRGDTADARAR